MKISKISRESIELVAMVVVRCRMSSFLRRKV